MTDGTAEISAQAWGPLGITLNTQIMEVTRKKNISIYSRYQKYLNTSGLPCFLMGKPESSKGYKNLTISSILMLIFSVVPIVDYYSLI